MAPKRYSLLLILFLAILPGIVLISQAESPQTSGRVAVHQTVLENPLPLDSEPLNGREPLILIHGIGPEKGEHFNWGRFIAYARRNAAFARRYKIYLFHFDPSTPIAETSRLLERSLHRFLETSGAGQFRVVALSQGGMIFRNAYEASAAIREATSRAITIGTPFHGTPIANPSWMKEQARHSAMFSPVRHTLGLTYHFVHRKFPHFEGDFCWDNLDLSLTPELNDGQPLACRPMDHPNWDTDKFITYGSFFGLDEDQNRFLLRQLGAGNVTLPEEERAGLFSRAVLFNVTRKKISRMPLGNGDKTKEQLPLMIYNDGVSPVSSSLWLGRFLNGSDDPTIRQAELWQSLRSLKGTGRARLFPGMDHQNWMFGQTRTRSTTLPDLLNPQEPARSVFDWFLYDLLNQ